MTVFVRYSVPVLAEVDLSVGRVLRVQVDDEAVAGPEEVFAVEQAPLGEDDQHRAREIAEDAPWPAWEFGG
jgi:hypothetical protein